MILVTGGAGYIGSHLVKAFLNQKIDIIVIDDLSTGSRDNLPNQTKLIEADITKSNWQAKLVDMEISAVIHLAAKTSASESVSKPDLYQLVNHAGSRNVWRFCQSVGIKRVLYASTAAVYGDLGLNKAKESSTTQPLTPYGQTKLAGEEALFELCPDSNCYSLRLFNVGGGQDKRQLGEPTVLHALNHTITTNSPFTIHGTDHPTKDGTPVRDFIHLKDVVAAFIHLATAKNDLPSGVYNIGSGVGTSIKDLVNLASVLHQQNIITKSGGKRVGDISYSVADIKKAKNIGWQPKRNLKDIVRDN